MKNILFIKKILPILALLLILGIGAHFRFIGIDWDDEFHLHPDERFLTMVESSISPVINLNEYFNTGTSTLNPNNSGYSFFVYGTFPVFLVRYLAEWIGETGYGQIYLVGRYLSGLADLLTVVLVFLITKKLYQNVWMAVFAATLASFSVLPIQQAHFFTVDSITNLFTTLAIYFAVCILLEHKHDKKIKPEISSRFSCLINELLGIKNYIFFGIVLGLAASSKINSVVVCVLLPIAVLINKIENDTTSHKKIFPTIIRNLIIAALFSFLVFRIFQPYAFSGLGFFNLNLNPDWLDSIKELSFLSSGDSNYPPSLQWARRSVWFGLENIIKFGIGIPFGIASLSGLVWMGWRIIKGEWKTHSMVWGWTCLYLVWQSLRWNPTMRYFLPIYPTLGIIAAWGLWKLRELKEISLFKKQIFLPWKSISTMLIGITVSGTFLWAFAFTNIYSRPVTRVTASEWIYKNVESAINLRGENDEGKINIPIAYPHSLELTFSEPLIIRFSPNETGEFLGIKFDHLVDPTNEQDAKSLQYSLMELPMEVLIDNGQISGPFSMGEDARGDSYEVASNPGIYLEKNKEYEIHILLPFNSPGLKISGNLSLLMSNLHGGIEQKLYKAAPRLTLNEDYTITFTPYEDIRVQEINIFRAVDYSGNGDLKSLRIEISDSSSLDSILTSGEITNTFNSSIDFRGNQYLTKVDKSVTLKAGHQYLLTLKLVSDDCSLFFYGSQQANESSWDDAIPLLMYGNNVYDYETGIYQSDLNFEMYWDDNSQKLTRMQDILNQADYLYITSNRQWGSTTQIPERYPLTTEYYRSLLGCPDDTDIQWCYRVAEPGMFKGKLGFDLIQVFQSNPNIGTITINSQFAEEAFTVYDHPKVFIFKKNENFSTEVVSSILSNIDLSKVINLTPAQANKTPGTLELSDEAKEIQYTGGTWSDLFDRTSFINSSPLISVLIWYLTITILGWIVYPMVRIAFGGLGDKGYPMIKLVGLLVWAVLVWMAGSIGMYFNKHLILVTLLLLLMINFWLFLRSKSEIIDEIKKYSTHFFRIELIALGLFVFFLLIRLGNPDLWHPYKGGEKPMDFSYFNAILKSTVFPPYDPWFADGYINYYYLGFILPAVPVKLLGLVPSIAYNLILPTFFSFSGMAAFCIGWNIASNNGLNEKIQTKRQTVEKNKTLSIFKTPYLLGFIALLFFLILGNQGTLRMIFHGLQRLTSEGVPIETENIVQRAIWTIEGIAKFIGGQNMSYYPGDWYWIPSRVIPGESITEFPYFTFLYGDLHAHLFALPLTLTVLVWCISLLRSEKEHINIRVNLLIVLLIGAIIVGVLRPTNTWDFPIYLSLSVFLLFYIGIRKNPKFKLTSEDSSSKIRTYMYTLLFVILYVFLSFSIYIPFSNMYGHGYTSLDLWEGSHTPFNSYLTHWGLFVFITISWIIWEIREWMANTPLSALKKIIPYKSIIIATILCCVILILFLLVRGIQISILVLPILIFQFLLLIRKYQSDLKRFTTFLSIIGFGLTLGVEVFVLRGDVGRMNTVFKFYLQAWTMLSLSSAIFLVWLLESIQKYWNFYWQRIWITILLLLVFTAALFPLLATLDKVTDRISTATPLTLDGMEFMKYSTYTESERTMDLSQDYKAIEWMQENVIGSPIIVEANVSEYRWGNRYSIYTGLPGVIGWNWHQRQQRAIVPGEWVTNRISEVNEFYSTGDLILAKEFLDKYQVEFIIVGQLEKIIYPENGINKFELMDGNLWDKVYQNENTNIYQVRE